MVRRPDDRRLTMAMVSAVLLLSARYADFPYPSGEWAPVRHDAVKGGFNWDPAAPRWAADI